MDLRSVLEHAAAAAARAAMPAVGRGDGDLVDRLAVDALRAALADAPVRLTVVAGEGEKDDAPMLDPGEVLGAGGPEYDLVVDPIDGTRLAAAGEPGAMAVLAAGPQGSFLDIGSALYLDKRLARVRATASLRAGSGGGAGATAGFGTGAGSGEADAVAGLVGEVAAALGRPVSAVTAYVQSRPRNAAVADAVRAAGARVEGFEHGDIERVLRVLHGDAELLLGVGGAPEGAIELALVALLGGSAALRAAPQLDWEAERVGVPVGGRGPWLEAPAPADASAAGGGIVAVIASATGVELGGGVRLAPVSPDGAVEVWSVAADGERFGRFTER